MAASGSTPDGKPFFFSDRGVPGLRLLVQSSKAAWIIRYGAKSTSKTLGYHFPGDHIRSITIKQARDLAQEVQRLVQNREEGKIDGVIAAFHEQRKGKKSVAKAVDEAKPVATTWTLKECFEQTIQDKRSQDHTNPISDAQEKDMRVTMGRSAFAKLMSTPAVLISQGDIESVRDTVKQEQEQAGNSGISPSNKVINHTRAVLDYCASRYSGPSGLGRVQPWWRMLATLYKTPKKKRKPHLEDIVRTLMLAEEYLDKPLPGRAIKAAGVKPGTLAGLWWIILTCQRSDAGLSLLPYNVGPDLGPDLASPVKGWQLAAWDEGTMKAGESFVLPVPARSWGFIQQLRSKNRHHASDHWVFPSEKDAEKHATVSGIYRILYRLAGRDALIQIPKQIGDETKKRDRKASIRTERKDLLAEAGIEWWSMHDVRRTLGEVLKQKGIPGGTSAILAHEVQESEALTATASEQRRADFLRQRTAKITRMAYDSESQFIELKREAMEIWTNAVLDCYEELTGKSAARRSVEAERALLLAIYQDATSLQDAKKHALIELEKKRHESVDALKKEEAMLLALMQSSTDLAKIRQVKAWVEESRQITEQYRTSPANELSRLSREYKSLSMIMVGGLRSNGASKIDLPTDAPEYEVLRTRFLLSEIDYETFKREVEQRWRIDFSLMSDRIVLPKTSE
ncbi:hypothetical protein BC374_17860 [Ensifer sp. LC13]|nr:hypothetical protein BC362_10105 [Ensifer sp. LC14]OCP10937.1 hypothetical protein BC374_17860 [Ensifer sp. LC13]OCP11520.1 hypothetical protein BBX50_18000 [Ensifer sp. LC11]OCP33336.1 hypothetical protein BC364_16885 [Ensifer sp. LC499]